MGLTLRAVFILATAETLALRVEFIVAVFPMKILKEIFTPAPAGADFDLFPPSPAAGDAPLAVNASPLATGAPPLFIETTPLGTGDMPLLPKNPRFSTIPLISPLNQPPTHPHETKLLLPRPSKRPDGRPLEPDRQCDRADVRPPASVNLTNCKISQRLAETLQTKT
jgi:hypothetical protein